MRTLSYVRETQPLQGQIKKALVRLKSNNNRNLGFDASRITAGHDRWIKLPLFNSSLDRTINEGIAALRFRRHHITCFVNLRFDADGDRNPHLRANGR